MERLLSKVELAEYLGIGVQTINNRISKKGDLPRFVKVGRTVLFPETEIQLWIHRQLNGVARGRPTKAQKSLQRAQ
jgi:excisionase family DNA binding protein